MQALPDGSAKRVLENVSSYYFVMTNCNVRISDEQCACRRYVFGVERFTAENIQRVLLDNEYARSRDVLSVLLLLQIVPVDIRPQALSLCCRRVRWSVRIGIFSRRRPSALAPFYRDVEIRLSLAVSLCHIAGTVVSPADNQLLWIISSSIACAVRICGFQLRY